MNQNDMLVLQAMRRAQMTNNTEQENLESNRQGRFTDFQKAILKTVAGGMKWTDFFIIVGVVLLSAISVGFLGGWALLLLVVLLIAAIFQIRNLHRRYLEKIIAEGVQSAVGRYIFNFDRNVYEIDISGEKGLRNIMINPVPGVYKFYFVRRLKFALSAESYDPQLVPSFDPEKHSLEKVIKRAVEFKNDDLKANRAGLLSENQRKRLKKEFIPLTILTGFCLLILIFVLYVSFLIGLESRDLSSNFMAGFLFSAAVLLLETPIFIRFYKVYSDLKQGSSLSVTGKGTRSSGKDSWLDWAALTTNFLGPAGNVIEIIIGFARLFGGKRQQKYFIGQKPLGVTETAYAALVEGISYTVYYLPKTGRILSIEQVSE